MDFLSSCTSGGCGAKIGAGELEEILKQLPKETNDHLLVGFDAADDAAVYKVSDQHAFISTVDFFTPMVEDPYLFGKIAAANAMSDVYAMGGKVLMALNLVCFPQKMSKDILKEILAGGAEKVKEAGAVLAGGHSIYDHETKYGLAVTGSIHPDHIIQNNTPKENDVLILTKPLGVGLIQAASRVKLASKKAEQAALLSMQQLNKYASEKLKGYPVHACTDVTGFGLLGHVSEMAGTMYTLVIDTQELPLLPEAYTYAKEYLATAGGQRNRHFMDQKVTLDSVDRAMQEILLDPQTSGGLLISVSPEKAEALLKDIQIDDPNARIIGTVEKKSEDTPIILL